MEGPAGVGPCLIRTVIFISLLAIVTCGSPTDFVGTPTSEEVSDLDASVRLAAGALLEAQGIEATAATTFDTGRREFRWINYRSGGEYAEIEVVQFVGEEGDEGSTRLSASVVFAEARYDVQSRSDGTRGSWTARERQPHERLNNPLLRLLPLTTPGEQFGSLTVVSAEYFETLVSEADDVIVTSQDTFDGGSVWTLTLSYPESTTTQLAYGIHPEGYLRSFDASTEGSESTTSTSLPEPAGRISVETDFEALSDPDPIQPPEPGTTLDLGRFDLPSGFPTS